jgi:predicted nucleic acid-binding protein
MPVVSNTSPVLNLAVIGRLSLLHDQFGEILIPNAVLEELRIQEDLPGSQATREALKEGWLIIQEVSNQSLVSVLQRELDNGEAEAITLAVQAKAQWILLDEKEGRKIAKSLGLRVAGILGILLRARQEGRLPSMQKAMDQLRNLAGFRIGAELYDDLVRKSGESK